MDTQGKTNADFWQDRYAEPGKRWSGNPNALLVREAEGLAQGRALDVGCGEGGDAIWLAAQGWAVTAVDIAQSAIDKAAQHAQEAGDAIAASITWERHDLEQTLPAGAFDLISACYFHTPVDWDRDGVLRGLAGLVAPGGSLLIVGHAGRPSWVEGPHPADDLPTPADVLAALALQEGDWEVATSDARVDVTMKAPDGSTATRPDNVLRIVRRG